VAWDLHKTNNNNKKLSVYLVEVKVVLFSIILFCTIKFYWFHILMTTWSANMSDSGMWTRQMVPRMYSNKITTDFDIIEVKLLQLCH